MMDFTAKLPIGDGKVIELSVVRDSFIRRRFAQQCNHYRSELDEALAELKCLDCGEKLSPIAYIKLIGEAWLHYERRIKEYQDGKRFYEAKTRCRCEHCKKMTRVRPATVAQVRKLQSEEQKKGKA
jgi:Zn finger protein HypA/HybF involved in hydrogenase expression